MGLGHVAHTKCRLGPSAPRVARAGPWMRTAHSTAKMRTISGDSFRQEALVTCPMGGLCWMPLATSWAQLEGWNPGSAV